MRNKRNDNYVSKRVNRIINSIPNNPFIGFGNTVNPFFNYSNDQFDDDGYETENPENPYKS